MSQGMLQDGYAGSSPPEYDEKKKRGRSDADLELDNTTSLAEGEMKFHRLGWKRLTVCLIVEAIALGSLSIPSAFATLGMVPGVILTVSLGLVAIYTSYVVGQVKLRHPHIEHYADGVRLIWGKFGYELTGVMFASFLILLTGSHVLTGTIAFVRIVDNPGTCALIWGVISAILLFLLALPPTFTEFAILGYIDFVSIIVAILITIIATAPDTTFYSAFLATTNIIFAYSFSVCQFSFMAEMHTPKDYVKSIWSLGLIEIFIYTLTGALVYAFVGSEVQSPALLSSSHTISRIAFGVALPVIFISGSINSIVVGQYILRRAFPKSPIRYIKGVRGWLTWIALIAIITIIGFIIAEAIPFFNALLGLISSLFISGFTYYFPALFWFGLIKEGKWNKNRKNITLSITNALVLVIGMVVLGAGTYASVKDILVEYSSGEVRGSFTCSAKAYSE
ncbi:hypothetical protein LTR37_020086 [Vermiconidia calcicola]|uniref:Uncharacterized protein n=1 Tax=Vermiconidia calcicola TaxID=1690605 RepID=A0ACC3MCF3_9PEZI|nr:hypothetical protein LTR37_020086 [Vermiconidia calcicola]